MSARTGSDITLRVRGVTLTRAPQETTDEGWGMFYMNSRVVDWAEACNRARAQVFPDLPLLVFDAKFDAIMRARAEREAAKK